MLVNTVLVVALQVRAAKGTDEPGAAARAFGVGGLLVAASCAAFALALDTPALVAAVLLVGGVALQSLGEVRGQAAAWALSYDLAPEGAHGEYQGVFNTGMSGAMMLGPVLITWLVIGHGWLGWAALAALFAVTGLAMAPAVRWAKRA
jgi:MFS family permease